MLIVVLSLIKTVVWLKVLCFLLLPWASCSSLLWTGRLSSRWQVDELRDAGRWRAGGLRITFSTINNGCSAVLLILWVLCSEADCIDLIQILYPTLLWKWYDDLSSASLYPLLYMFYYIYPCDVSYTTGFVFTYSYLDNRPWLPGTPFSALSPCLRAGVMGGRHIWYQSFG